MVTPELLTRLQDDWRQLGSYRRDAFARALKERAQKRRNVLPFRPPARPPAPGSRDRPPATIIALHAER